MKKTMKILCVEGNHRGIVIPVPIDADFIEASAFCKKFRQTSYEDGEWVVRLGIGIGVGLDPDAVAVTVAHVAQQFLLLVGQ